MTIARIARIILIVATVAMAMSQDASAQRLRTNDPVISHFDQLHIATILL